ncbi:MAG: tetratricopeptide repeat protein [Planctomycetota bacterium]|jgi:tetratricopeptide (TPR) repeat protein
MRFSPSLLCGKTFILGVVLFAFAAGPALGDDLEALKKRLDSYLLTDADLPPRWGLLRGSAKGEEHDFILGSLQQIQDKVKEFAVKSQGLKFDLDEFDIYLFTYKDDRALKALLETLEKNKQNFDWGHFRVGDVMIMLYPNPDGAIEGLTDIMGRKMGRHFLEQARKEIQEKKLKEAAETLKKMTETIKECPAVLAWAGDCYLRDFSPPQISAASNCFQKAREGHAKIPLRAYELWIVHRGRGEEAVTCVGPAGERLKAQTLFDLARLQLAAKNEDGAFTALEKAIETDFRFGSKAILGSVRAENLFADFVKQERVQKLLETYEGKTPADAVAAPGVKKLAMNKIKVLICPPVVQQGSLRRNELEAAIEKGLARKFRKKGLVFGEKRDAVTGGSQGDLPAKICARLRDALVEDGSLDLFQFRGNQFKVPGMLRDVENIASRCGVLKFNPQYIVIASVSMAEGSLGMNAKACVALYHPGSRKVIAFHAREFSGDDKELKGHMLRLGGDAVRKMESALRKNR